MSERETIRVGAISVRFRLEASDTDDALTMFECHVPAAARVPIPHSHDSFEESIYGLAGEVVFTVGGTEHTIGPGDAVAIPRGVVHGFTNASDADATFLAVATPGTFGAGYFRDIADAIPAAGPPDPATLAAIMRRHGLTPAPPKEG